MGSTSLQPQNRFYELTSHAWSKQDGGNEDIDQVLNPRHALVATDKRLLNGGITLCTDCNVNVYFGNVVSHGWLLIYADFAIASLNGVKSSIVQKFLASIICK